MHHDSGNSIQHPPAAHRATAPPESGTRQRVGGCSFSRCACCGRSLTDDQIAARTQIRTITLNWCRSCHAGQHWLNLGYTAAEVK